MLFRSMAYIAAVTIGFALVSRRLARSPITGPMFFTAAGFLGAYLGAWDPVLEAIDATVILEFTLGLVLFTEAMKLRLVSWTDDFELPTRLLAIGMPLTILAGTIVAAVVFPEVGFAGAAIIATVLAPTDATLGLAVVENPKVPERIREALSVESGLNDGIALPVLLFFLALEAAEGGTPLWSLFLEGVGVAVVVGVAFAMLFGYAMREASRRGWMEGRWQEITIAVVPVVCFIVADGSGGSGFIATFVGGLVFGRMIKGMDETVADFAEDAGTWLTMFSFMVFGGVLLADQLDVFTAATIGYAALSLTVVRMLPVAISLTGAELDPPTTAFIGWFGPRGLASIIFAAVVVGEIGVAQADTVIAVMVVTVTLSIFLHGVSAYPGSEAYGNWYQQAHPT